MTLQSPPPSELAQKLEQIKVVFHLLFLTFQRKDEILKVITQLHKELEKPFLSESYQIANDEYLFESLDFSSLEKQNKDEIKSVLQGVISELETIVPLSLYDDLFPRSIKSGEEVEFNSESIRSNGVTKAASVLQDDDNVWFTGLIEASKTVFWEGDVGNPPVKYIKV